ncbi:MAG: threonine synthase [Gammaproteobacteria bacterium]|nr:threonine synthase [Gammaproteobacteria bacterium]MDH3410572.1 threonine synthase [Gammaproteobacteria bacterium]MDH3552771.1 threonine synthase [Gammaproteobacteria bacterium]
MQFVSTRGGSPVSLDAALVNGIADDGGLYVPIELPSFATADFDGAGTIPEVAAVLLRPFFTDSALRDDMAQILAETFSFPILSTPLPTNDGHAALLELYHGPTAAFKDVGAGFLAACLSRLEGDEAAPLTILVATSGDTGGAVAAAFNERPGMRVVVLFPEGRVSARQAHQLTCWSDNVLSLSVQGAFDDCQALVKFALADPVLSSKYRFSSANSINIGRLLPQSTYYANASLRHYDSTGRKPGFVIPTGNLGNALACIMAREMGLPIGPIVLATNANRTIPDYFETLQWLPRASVQTLASAMDVGDPSNMERLRSMLGDAEVLRDCLGVTSVDDTQIEAEIKRDFAEFGFATCPHTATAIHTWRQFDTELRAETDWILVATAHPAKFETIVEPLIGVAVPLPKELAEILSRPSHSVAINADLDALAVAMAEHFG